MFFAFAFWHGNQVATDPGYQRSRQKPFDATEHTVTLLVLSEPKLDPLRSSATIYGARQLHRQSTCPLSNFRRMFR